jgi:hypothetical protein
MIRRRVLGCVVEWTSSDHELHAQIEALTGLLPHCSDPPDFTLSLEPLGEAVELRQDGAHATRVERAHAFSLAMQWMMVELLQRTDLVALHAGMVEKAGAALLLPAMTGSGKSTLVAALLARGFRFGSDELAPLDSVGRVSSYPLPMRIRRDALARLSWLEDALHPASDWIARKGGWSRFLLPAAACEPVAFPVEMIVFPHGAHALDEPRVRRCSAGEATLRLLAEQVKQRVCSATDFDVCNRLAARVPCYEIVAGDPLATAARVEALWEAR